MKKILSIIVMSALLFTSLVSCATTDGGKQTETNSKETTVSQSTSSQTISTTPTPPPEEEAVYMENARMIISKATGKVVGQRDNSLVVENYEFLLKQTWDIEENGNGVTLTNCQSQTKLSDGNSHAVWLIDADDAGWTYLKNEDTGRFLTVKDGTLFFADSISGQKAEMWCLNQVFIREIAHSDTSWMEGKFGVMYHVLPNASTISSIGETFDADAIAEQLEDIGADFFILTVGQNTGYWNTENKVYSSLVTYRPNGRYTSKDIISEMGLKLKEKGIKFIVYTVPCPAMSIQKDCYDMNFTEKISHYKVNTANGMLWSLVLQDWANTYGDLVDGWWVDGCYDFTGFDDDIAALYASALKMPNPKACVSFNNGIVLEPYVSAEDFTSGETNLPLGDPDAGEDINDRANWLLPESPTFSTGTRWFELTFIGVSWSNPTLRYTPQLWQEYVQAVISVGGCICLDTASDWNNGFRIPEQAMEILSSIKE